MSVLQSIIQALLATPPELLGAYTILIFGPLPILGVLIWGFAQIWLDRKQGQYWSNLKWDLLAVSVPQDAVQTPKGMENFFNNLAGSKSSITWKEKWMYGKFQAYFCLEIASVGGDITFYIRTQVKYRDLVEAALYAQYPEAQITEVEDYVDSIPEYYPDEEYDLWGSEMVMKKPSYLPIRTWEMFEHQGEKDLRFKDPLLPFLEVMGKMQPGENYWIQILIMGPDSQDDWRNEGQQFIKDLYGKEDPKKKGLLSEHVGWVPKEMATEITGQIGASEAQQQQDNFRMFKITPDERDAIDMVTQKISKIGWYTKIRFVYAAKKELFRKGTIASMSKGIWNQFAHLNTNKLSLHDASTPKDDYFYMEWQMPAKQRNLLARYKKRSFGPGATPYVLNSEELATIFHFPAADARTPVLTSLGSRRAEAPVELNYAGAGKPVMQNLKRTEEDTKQVMQKAHEAESKPLAVPRPESPTPTVPKEETIWKESQAPGDPDRQAGTSKPAPGVPAPLPPGLDLSVEEVSADSPENLPLED